MVITMGNTSQNNWRNKMTARLVCGWGHNDMVGVPGWRSRDCPFYGTWKDMLRRRQNRYDHRTRRDVTVCEEWKFLSHFIAWAKTQDYEGKQLDKDIRIPGNKHYSPDACLYVKRHINSQKLFEPRKYLDDHPYPEGVEHRRNKGLDKYQARIQIDGEKINLKSFSTVEAASSAYCKAKSEYLRVLAEEQKQEPILKEALLRWADIYELEIVYLRDNKR
jgi:hypothetical protein